MAECPAKQSPRSWWDCPTARELHFKVIDADRKVASMPLFYDAGVRETAQAAYDAHISAGHPDEEV